MNRRDVLKMCLGAAIGAAVPTGSLPVARHTGSWIGIDPASCNPSYSAITLWYRNSANEWVSTRVECKNAMVLMTDPPAINKENVF